MCLGSSPSIGVPAENTNKNVLQALILVCQLLICLGMRHCFSIQCILFYSKVKQGK